jgi:Protein of unknown function (DUF992)
MALRVIFRLVIASIITAGLVNSVSVSRAQAQLLGKSKLYVGALSCNVSGSVGFIFGSTKNLSCILIRPNGSSELYDGTINRFGIDIGFTKAVHVVWHVYSLNENAPSGALAGNYVGTQTSVALGGTAGGNALLGGGNDAIILQSVVVQGGNTGINFADGIAEMSLTTSQ